MRIEDLMDEAIENSGNRKEAEREFFKRLKTMDGSKPRVPKGLDKPIRVRGYVVASHWRRRHKPEHVAALRLVK